MLHYNFFPFTGLLALASLKNHIEISSLLTLPSTHEDSSQSHQLAEAVVTGNLMESRLEVSGDWTEMDYEEISGEMNRAWSWLLHTSMHVLLFGGMAFSY